MDERLDELWKIGSYPFTQNIIYLDDYVEITKLLDCIKNIVEYLKSRLLDSKLFLNHDWHEHDGYISSSNEINWSNLENNLNNIDLFYNSRDEDTYVRIAIYSGELEFVLRYYILEEDECDEYPEIWGNLDITVDEKYYNNIIKIIEENNIRYNILCAKEYFDKWYSG